MKVIGLIFVPSLILTAVLAVSAGGWFHQGSPRASAQDELPIVVAIDMNPTGNSCPGDGTNPCTLGTIDSCVAIPAGGSFDFDVVLQNVWPKPPGSGLGGYDFRLLWGGSVTPAEADVIDITAQAAINGAVQILQQATGSLATPGDVQPLPRLIPPYVASYYDVGTDEPCDPTVPSGWCEGTAGRYTASVSAAAAPGIYKLELDPSFIYVNFTDATNACDPNTGGPGCTLQSATFAVDAPCPPPPTLSPTPVTTPTPTTTATASPTSTVSPTPTATVTPSPGSTPLVAGWNDACYQGLSQAIGDAFASVMTNVQAVYRMKPDQTFDRWFPARLDLSTITTLNPFDQLFILMSAGGVWTAQPLAPLTSSASLNPGWNSVCYLGGGKDTAAAVTGISGGFSIIYSLPPDQSWRRFVPGNPDVSNLARLETFTSILVLMTEGGTWAFSP